MKHQTRMFRIRNHIRQSSFGIFLLASCLSLGSPDPCTAQAEEQIVDKSTIVEMFRQLRNGVLIVRLESNRRKIEALEKILENPGLSRKERRRVEQKLLRAKEEAGAHTQEYVSAFRNNYDFSDVVFMYDYQTNALLDKQITFFDTSFNEVPGTRVMSRSYLLLSEGTSDYNAARVLEFLSKDLRPLGKPAPRSHFGVLSFLTPAELRILRLNRKLHKLVE